MFFIDLELNKLKNIPRGPAWHVGMHIYPTAGAQDSLEARLMIWSSNVEKHYVFQSFGAQMLKNTMFFNDLELKC